MPLDAGARLGPYEVTAQIGAGGMGVYRARDTSLDRDVAIKVLPAEFASDPERLARFEREAKVLASLNHPNIAHIHGLERSGDTPALILELVEGPTLAELIARPSSAARLQTPGTRPEAARGLPIDDALPIARQIAEALEAAHEQGIINRDLKPANIKVTPDGVVKVLDFGLAKALEPEISEADAADSPTMSTTAAATRAGFILGTAAYMSPEQAKGRPVDKRTDIWAFSVVLYEMLTTSSRLTFDSAQDQYPVWSPDGERMLFRSNRDGNFGLHQRAADGTGGVEELAVVDGAVMIPTTVTPDGAELVFHMSSEGSTNWDLHAIELAERREIRAVIATEFNERNGDISPDGRWLAYEC